MSKIICPCTECLYNGDGNICKAKQVEFKYRNMATVNEGRVDMRVCKQYELSDFAKELEREFKMYYKQGGEQECQCKLR